MEAALLMICGPTASGKSHLAQQIARRVSGIIINFDAIQVYKELRILTARPTEAEEAALPHRLYGHVSMVRPHSAAQWLVDVKKEIDQCVDSGKLPVLVGGTGLYMKALMDGLSEIPSVPAEIRTQVEHIYKEKGEAAFRALLAEKDPVSATRLKPNDAQRLKRAYEVALATGKPLSYWQETPKTPPYPNARFLVLNVDIPRDLLYARCDARFDAMLGAGALDEAKSIKEQVVDRKLPAMKAIGLPQLLGYLEGQMSLDEARIHAKQMTRNYAKRQLTWFKNQLPDKVNISHDFAQDPAILGKIEELLLKFIDRKPAKD